MSRSRSSTDAAGRSSRREKGAGWGGDSRSFSCWPCQRRLMRGSVRVAFPGSSRPITRWWSEGVRLGEVSSDQRHIRQHMTESRPAIIMPASPRASKEVRVRELSVMESVKRTMTRDVKSLRNIAGVHTVQRPSAADGSASSLSIALIESYASSTAAGM